MPSSRLHNESIPIDSLYMHASITTKVYITSVQFCIRMHYSIDILLLCFFNIYTATSVFNYEMAVSFMQN